MKKTLLGAALAAGLVVVAAPTAASAADTVTVCAVGCDYTTIQAAVNAASAGDVIEVTGDLTVAGQTTVNKDVTITGDATITQTASAITFLVNGAGATIEGLTITSDVAYPREFIQIGANDVTITGTTIFGPEQPLPMSGWVGNRAIVTQGSKSGIEISDNDISSLRSGMYLNPNGSGVVSGNTFSYTKGDALIDNANFTFTGNRAGDRASEWSFVIFANTDPSRYPSVEELSAANNWMTVWDQRTGEQYRPVILQSKDECKNGGWATSTVPVYKNQGQCVSSFAKAKH